VVTCNRQTRDVFFLDMMVSRGPRSSLTQGLDKEVYQVVRKLADEQAQFEKGGKRLTTSIVYDSIKRSNSSLKRRSKKLLEDSIDRVLNVMKEELDDDSDSLEGDFDGIEEPGPQLKVDFSTPKTDAISDRARNTIS